MSHVEPIIPVPLARVHTLQQPHAQQQLQQQQQVSSWVRRVSTIIVAQPSKSALRAWILGASIVALGAVPLAYLTYSYLRDSNQRMMAAAKKAFVNGSTQEAVEIWRKMLQRNPQQPIVLTNLANAHIQLSRFQEALQLADDALKLKPGASKPMLAKARALLSLERFDEAHDELELMLKNLESNIEHLDPKEHSKMVSNVKLFVSRVLTAKEAHKKKLRQYKFRKHFISSISERVVHSSSSSIESSSIEPPSPAQSSVLSSTDSQPIEAPAQTQQQTITANELITNPTVDSSKIINVAADRSSCVSAQQNEIKSTDLPEIDTPTLMADKAQKITTNDDNTAPDVSTYREAQKNLADDDIIVSDFEEVSDANKSTEQATADVSTTYKEAQRSLANDNIIVSDNDSSDADSEMFESAVRSGYFPQY